MEQGARKVGDEAKEAGDQIQQGARKAGQEVEEDAERTGEKVEQSAEQAGQKTGEATDKTLDEMNKTFQSGVQGKDKEGAMTDTQAPEVEILEGKEGPNNEVVYKYQGDLYYVDREKGQLVKVKESELKDSDEKVIVKESASDPNASSSNRGQDASSTNANENPSSTNTNENASSSNTGGKQNNDQK